MESEGSVFLRIAATSPGDRVATYLIEVDREGYIPREVGLAADGTAVYVTRPEEYGVWNDSLLKKAAPGTREFEQQWQALGTEIPRAEFEAAYEPAAEVLPETIGGTPLWVSDVASLLIVFAAIAALLALGYLITRLIGIT